MDALRQQTIEMIGMLPEKELTTINELLKLLVPTWDLDYTKVTQKEKQILDTTVKEMEQGIYFTEDEVWND